MNPIVDPSIFSPPATPSPVDPVQKMLNAMIAKMESNLESDMALFYQLANFIWHNPQGKTPQQMFDYIATSSASLKTYCDNWLTFVTACNNGVAPVTLPPAGFTLTPNQDGTVTVASI